MRRSLLGGRGKAAGAPPSSKNATMHATRMERTIVVDRKHVGKKLTGGDGIGL